jgi:5-methylcytosine-specific restriction endonuclease McrA
MDALQYAVLVLNASYEPINVCSTRRALKLIFKGAAMVEEQSERRLRTAQGSLPLPAVIRLLSYRHVPRPTSAVSRRGVLIRDGFSCQYCQTNLPPARLTLDHVVPRSRGGRSTWENLVSCCYPCNNRKGNRTPGEAHMPLVRPPKAFGALARHRQAGHGNELWNKYLFCRSTGG